MKKFLYLIFTLVILCGCGVKEPAVDNTDVIEDTDKNNDLVEDVTVAPTEAPRAEFKVMDYPTVGEFTFYEKDFGDVTEMELFECDVKVTESILENLFARYKELYGDYSIDRDVTYYYNYEPVLGTFRNSSYSDYILQTDNTQLEVSYTMEACSEVSPYSLNIVLHVPEEEVRTKETQNNFNSLLKEVFSDDVADYITYAVSQEDYDEYYEDFAFGNLDLWEYVAVGDCGYRFIRYNSNRGGVYVGDEGYGSWHAKFDQPYYPDTSGRVVSDLQDIPLNINIEKLATACMNAYKGNKKCHPDYGISAAHFTYEQGVDETELTLSGFELTLPALNGYMDNFFTCYVRSGISTAYFSAYDLGVLKSKEWTWDEFETAFLEFCSNYIPSINLNEWERTDNISFSGDITWTYTADDSTYRCYIDKKGDMHFDLPASNN